MNVPKELEIQDKSGQKGSEGNIAEKDGTFRWRLRQMKQEGRVENEKVPGSERVDFRIYRR